MIGWVLTISCITEDGHQTDRCWAVTEESLQDRINSLGTPNREYMSSPEVNAVRKEAEAGSVIIDHDE